MVKAIIKEIIITLLLILAAILVLMVLFYNYIPNNKIIPKTVSYTTPANVKEEIASSQEAEQSEIVMTYEIDSSDLSNYKRTQDYVVGRKNPFSSVNTNTSTSTENTSGSENTSNSGNGSGSASSGGGSSNSDGGTSSEQGSQNSGGSSNNSYLPNKGTK